MKNSRNVRVIQLFALVVLFFPSLPLHAGESPSKEGLIFLKMDFPKQKPSRISVEAEYNRILQLWAKAKVERKFTLVRTVRHEEKKMTTSFFLSDPIPVNVEGAEQWVEFWSKYTFAFDDPKICLSSGTFRSGASRFIFCRKPASQATVATFYFESCDASGFHDEIRFSYPSPEIVDGKWIRKPPHAEEFKDIIEHLENNPVPMLAEPTPVDPTPVEAEPICIDQIPMYGGMDRNSNPILKAADEQLIASMIQHYGTRGKGSAAFVENGFKYYQQDDLVNAMRRFNQAWLLVPNNPEVYAGFGSVLHDRGDYCGAMKMMEQALSLNPPVFQGIYPDAARTVNLCAVNGQGFTSVAKAKLFERSESLYKKAEEVELNTGYVYDSWAESYYRRGLYPEAWAMVAKLRAAGGEPRAKFIGMLREKMSEPAQPTK